MSRKLTNPLVYQIRRGSAKAAVLLNNTRDGPRHTIRVSRLYFEDSEWQHAQSFRLYDLPHLVSVIQDTWRWIYDVSLYKDRDEQAYPCPPSSLAAAAASNAAVSARLRKSKS